MGLAGAHQRESSYVRLRSVLPQPLTQAQKNAQTSNTAATSIMRFTLPM